MKKVEQRVDWARSARKLRDRCAGRRAAVAGDPADARAKGAEWRKDQRQAYRKLLRLTRQVVNQAKRFSKEITNGVKWPEASKQAGAEGWRPLLEEMPPLVPSKQVIRQTKARVLQGNTKFAGTS